MHTAFYWSITLLWTLEIVCFPSQHPTTHLEWLLFCIMIVFLSIYIGLRTNILYCTPGQSVSSHSTAFLLTSVCWLGYKVTQRKYFDLFFKDAWHLSPFRHILLRISGQAELSWQWHRMLFVWRPLSARLLAVSSSFMRFLPEEVMAASCLLPRPASLIAFLPPFFSCTALPAAASGEDCLLHFPHLTSLFLPLPLIWFLVLLAPPSLLLITVE